MAKPFGYIDIQNLSTDNASSNNYYIDYSQEEIINTIGHSINNSSDLNNFLIKKQLSSITSNIWYKINNSDNFVSYENIVFPINTLSLKCNLAFFFRIQDEANHQYGFDYASQPSNTHLTDPNGFVYRDSEITEGPMQIKIDKYTKNPSAITDKNTIPPVDSWTKAGFGHIPANYHLTYLDGAFQGTNSVMVKPLQERMKYTLQYNKNYNSLTVYTYIPDLTACWYEGLTNGNINWISNATLVNYHFGDSDPIIYINVCNPAVYKSQPAFTGATVSFNLKCGTTEGYFINLKDLVKNGQNVGSFDIICSNIVVDKKPYTWIAYPLCASPNDSDTAKLWFQNKNRELSLAYFTSDEIEIKINNVKQTSFEKHDKSSYTCSGTVHWDIDSYFNKITSNLNMPNTMSTVVLYSYEIPYFYNFHKDVCGCSLTPSSFINLSSNDTYLVKNNSDDRWALCISQNSNNERNLPGFGDFQHSIASNLDYSPANTYDILLQFDAHTLNLCPGYYASMGEYSGGGVYIPRGLLLPSQALFNTNDITVNRVRLSTTPHEVINNIDSYGIDFWMKMQNSWFMPAIYTEDRVFTTNNKKPYYKDARGYGSILMYQGCCYTKENGHYMQTLIDFMDPEYSASLYNIASLGASVKKGDTWKAHSWGIEITASGMFMKSWWKNTESIPANSNSYTNSNIADFINTTIKWKTNTDYGYPLMASSAPEDNSDRYAFLEKCKKYNYIYPSSSQAPGAIAIYAVTW